MQTVLCWAEHLRSILASILQLGIRRHSETAFSCDRKNCQQGSAADCTSAASIRVSVAVIEHHGQKQLGKKSLSPHVLLLVEKVMVGTQGRNLESRTKADAMEEWRVLPYSLWTDQPAFLPNSE